MDSFAENSNHTEENGTLGRTFFPRDEVPHSRDHPAARLLVVVRGTILSRIPRAGADRPGVLRQAQCCVDDSTMGSSTSL
jgi:hypothetical protein